MYIIIQCASFKFCRHWPQPVLLKSLVHENKYNLSFPAWNPRVRMKNIRFNDQILAHVYSKKCCTCWLIRRGPEYQLDVSILQLYNCLFLFQINISERYHLLPITTPAYPQQNTTFNVTLSSRSIMTEKLKDGRSSVSLFSLSQR